MKENLKLNVVKSAEVITIGEPMAVYISEYPGQLKDVNKYYRGIAGAELNVAVGLSRLNHSVRYLTKLGKDPYGEMIFDFLQKERIITDGVLWDSDRLTGSYLKSKVIKGDPDIFYFRKDSAASTYCPEDIKRDYLRGKILHITGISAGISLSMRNAVKKIINMAKETGLLITFDPNLRKTLWKSPKEMTDTINELATQSDIIMPGIEEARILTGETEIRKMAKFYLDKGVKTVIIKTGKRGACLFDSKTEKEIGGFQIENIVDTVGAGDAFAAGVISGILEGMDMENAVLRGNAMGAIIVSSPGDNDGLPERQDLYQFMNQFHS